MFDPDSTAIAMQFINHREGALIPFQERLLARLGCTKDALRSHLTGEENPARLFGEMGLLILLLHVYAIGYLLKPAEQETAPKTLVMDVALIAAAPAPPKVKTVTPAPSVTQPKQRPKPKKPKKAPALPKSVTAPVQEAAPMAKPEAAPPVSDSAPPVQSPAISAAAKSKSNAETFTEANYRANYRSNPKPEYPRIARSRNWQGKVLLRVQVTADGQSANVSVQQSSGHRQLDESAIKAVKNWTFIPAKRGGTPVASTVTVPIQFKLNE